MRLSLYSLIFPTLQIKKDSIVFYINFVNLY